MADLTTHVALLRGINVGGNNKVPMAELRTALADRGLQSVQTYINSGNVIFDADASLSATELSELCGKVMVSEFDVTNPVLVVPEDEYLPVAEAIPEHWRNDKEMKGDVFFLFPESDRPEVIDEVGPQEEIEEMVYVPRALLWHIDRKFYNRSNMSKVVGTPFYRQVTVRNVNTTRKLAALLAARRD